MSAWSFDKRQEIFFVDDDPKSGELFARFARTEGLVVRHFTDPMELLEQCLDSSPALVISDQKMPGMTGLALLARLRELGEQHPSLGDLPFVLISGYADVDSVISALRLGACDVLRKPYDPGQLLDVCQRALEAWVRERENQRLRQRAEDALAADWPDLETLERRYIERVLAECEGNRPCAARRLGIDKSTLWRKLKRYGQA